MTIWLYHVLLVQLVLHDGQPVSSDKNTKPSRKPGKTYVQIEKPLANSGLWVSIMRLETHRSEGTHVRSWASHLEEGWGKEQHDRRPAQAKMKNGIFLVEERNYSWFYVWTSTSKQSSSTFLMVRNFSFYFVHCWKKARKVLLWSKGATSSGYTPGGSIRPECQNSHHPQKFVQKHEEIREVTVNKIQIILNKMCFIEITNDDWNWPSFIKEMLNFYLFFPSNTLFFIMLVRQTHFIHSLHPLGLQ